MRVFVIGGSGLVGRNVIDYCRSSNIDVRGTYNSTQTETASIQLDKTDPHQTAELIADYDPDIVIDTAAFHAVDECESQRDKAWTVNAVGTRNAAAAAANVDAHFVYLSTDYVFPGKQEETPYAESDPIAPLNYYAQTKYAGEQAAKVADRTTILRGSVIYGLASYNFLTWALGELQDGNDVGIVDDQMSTPTYASDIARASVSVAERSLTGVYHAGGPESLSRYEFTKTLADVFGYDPGLVSPITSGELGQDAPRPTDSSLDSTTLYDAINFEFHKPEAAFKQLKDEENY